MKQDMLDGELHPPKCSHPQPTQGCLIAGLGAAKTHMHDLDWDLTCVMRASFVFPFLPADPCQAPTVIRSRTAPVCGPPHVEFGIISASR